MSMPVRLVAVCWHDPAAGLVTSVLAVTADHAPAARRYAALTRADDPATALTRLAGWLREAVEGNAHRTAHPIAAAILDRLSAPTAVLDPNGRLSPGGERSISDFIQLF